MDNTKKQFQWEWLVFGIFLIGYIIITVFHEPWFDEAEAWQIAKCASLKEILFINPHYEGHPPLWHLILRIPIVLGVPFEWGLKVVSGLFTSISVWLILFKSPFSRPIRFLIPFGYFFFYQYGVIARPYCLMILAFILLSISFKSRNNNPIWFVLSLSFLCLTSAYGILLAGGITLAWLIELFKKDSWKSIKQFFLDKRVWLLFFLFVLAMLLVIEIIPSENTRAIFKKENSGSFSLTNILYTFFVMIPDCFITSIDQGYAGQLSVSVPTAISCAIIEFVILFAFVYRLKIKSIKYVSFPLIIFMLFFAFVYNCIHHIGIVALLFLFVFWISEEDFKEEKTFGNFLMKKFSFISKNDEKIKQFVKIVIYVCLIIPIFWSLMASVNEISNPYSFSRETARFIKQNNLSNALIIGEYTEDLMDGDLLSNYAVEISPYFEHNIVMNQGKGEDNKAYVDHIIVSKDVVNSTITFLQKQGKPDVLLGSNCLNKVYDDLTLRDYAPVYTMKGIGPAIWKYSLFSLEDGNCEYIFLRRDLLSKYNLKEIPMLY